MPEAELKDLRRALELALLRELLRQGAIDQTQFDRLTREVRDV